MAWKSKDWASNFCYVSIFLFITAVGTVLHGQHPTAAIVALVLCISSFVVWFLLAFTGDAIEKLAGMFVFAYVFTFVSFGLLLLPPASTDATRDHSPLALIRGCAVERDIDPGLVPYPKSMSCTVQQGRQQGLPQESSVTTVTGQISLLAVGGVQGARMPTGCGSASAPCEYVQVSSGLAVPMYVIILAFVGAAVSLSRRIPEYQKRSDAAYVGKDDQPALAAIDAREAVVFQVMQLISAPFIAMSAYYIVGPSTLGAAVGLAFACGFASEPILLMIRGAVTGIRPEGSKIQSSARAVVNGTVSNGAGPVEGAFVSVEGLPGAATTTDSGGRFLISGAPPGVHRLVARKEQEMGSATINVQRLGASTAEIIIQLPS